MEYTTVQISDLEKRISEWKNILTIFQNEITDYMIKNNLEEFNISGNEKFLQLQALVKNAYARIIEASNKL